SRSGSRFASLALCLLMRPGLLLLLFALRTLRLLRVLLLGVGLPARERLVRETLLLGLSLLLLVERLLGGHPAIRFRGLALPRPAGRVGPAQAQASRAAQRWDGPRHPSRRARAAVRAAPRTRRRKRWRRFPCRARAHDRPSRRRMRPPRFRQRARRIPRP